MTAFKKKVLALALAGTFALSQSAFVSAATTTATPSQKYLSVIEMGLIKGTSTGAAGTNVSTNGNEPLQRYRAFTLQARLLGFETQMEAFIADEANSDADNFEDAAGKSPYVKGAMAFFKKELKATGDDGKTFRPLDPIKSHEFYKMMLEALGYEYDNDGGADFTYEEVAELAVKAGLVADAKEITEDVMTEAQAGFALYDTLAATVKTPSEGTWTHSLANELVIAKKAPTSYAKPFDTTAPTLTLTEPKGVVISPTDAKNSKGLDVVTTATVDMADGMPIAGTSTEPGSVLIKWNGQEIILPVDPVTLKFADESRLFNFASTNVISITGLDLAGNATHTLTYNLNYSFKPDKTVADSLSGIKIVFNDPVSLTSINKANFTLTDVTNNYPVKILDVVGAFGDNKTVLVVPETKLSTALKYKVGVAAGLKNSSGSSLATAYTSPELTVTDTTNPVVVRTQFMSDKKARLYFSEPIFNSSITDRAQYEVNGGLLVGYIDAAANRTYVDVYNDYGFNTGANTIRLKATDDAGYAFVAPVNYVGADVTPPVLEGVTSVAPYSITLKFNEAVRSQSIFASKLSVKYTSDGAVVTAVSSDVIADDLVTYYFYAPLRIAEIAEATVTGVQDVAKNTLATQTVTFNTAATAATATVPSYTLSQGSTPQKIKVTFDRAVRFLGAFNTASPEAAPAVADQCFWFGSASENNDWAMPAHTYSVAAEDIIYRNGTTVPIGYKAITITIPTSKVGYSYSFNLKGIYDATAPTQILNETENGGQSITMKAIPAVSTVSHVAYVGGKLYVTFNTELDRNSATTLSNYIVSDNVALSNSTYLPSGSTAILSNDLKTVIITTTLTAPINQYLTVQNVKSLANLTMMPISARAINASLPFTAPVITDVKQTATNDITVVFDQPVSLLTKFDMQLFAANAAGVRYDVITTWQADVALKVSADRKSAVYTFRKDILGADGKITLPNDQSAYIGSTANGFAPYLAMSPYSGAVDTYNRAVSIAGNAITVNSKNLAAASASDITNNDDTKTLDYVSFKVNFDKPLNDATVTTANLNSDLLVTVAGAQYLAGGTVAVIDTDVAATIQTALETAASTVPANKYVAVYNKKNSSMTMVFKTPAATPTLAEGTIVSVARIPGSNTILDKAIPTPNGLGMFAGITATVPAPVAYTSALPTTTPGATVSDVTVAGKAGDVLTATDVTITLTNATFKNAIPAGTTLSTWFVGTMPTGMDIKAKAAVAAGASSVVVTFTGTPATRLVGAMVVMVPATELANNVPVVATPNANAKFNITAPVAAVSNVAITGGANTGKEITGEFTITLTDDMFLGFTKDEVLTAWIATPGTGLVYTAKEASNPGGTQVVVKVSGKATAAEAKASLVVTIPAGKLFSNVALTPTANTNAYVEIIGAATAPSDIATDVGTATSVAAISAITFNSTTFTYTAIASGYVAGTKDTLKLTVTDSGLAVSTIKVAGSVATQGATYTSGADLKVIDTAAAVETVTFTVTTKEEDLADVVYTIVVTVTQ